MEYIEFAKDVKKYGIKKGEKIIVKRTIMNECVVCTGEGRINWITSETTLKKYGKLTGEPQLCFN